MSDQGQSPWVGDLVGPSRGGSLSFKQNLGSESNTPGGEKNLSQHS